MRKNFNYHSVNRPFLRGLIGLILFVSFGYGCQKDHLTGDVEVIEKPYSFFVAGHTGVNHAGLNSLFQAKFELINRDTLIQFGVLTGDIVRYCIDRDWDIVDQDLQLLDMPVHFAVGNHDVEDRPLYESRYGATYYSFEHGQDLFIILDPNLDRWNISADQLTFLKGEVVQSESRRIFIFFHQLLWWTTDNKYKNELPNSLKDRDPDLNFWTEIEPFLRQQSQEIFLIAGDIGVHPDGTGFFYHQYDNLTLAASGMGAGPTDNFVIVDVLPDGEVDFRLISLWGDDIHALGDLEDYELK